MGMLRSENAYQCFTSATRSSFELTFRLAALTAFQVNSHADLIFLCEKFDHSAQIGKAVDVADC